MTFLFRTAENFLSFVIVLFIVIIVIVGDRPPPLNPCAKYSAAHLTCQSNATHMLIRRCKWVHHVWQRYSWIGLVMQPRRWQTPVFIPRINLFSFVGFWCTCAEALFVRSCSLPRFGRRVWNFREKKAMPSIYLVSVEPRSPNRHGKRHWSQLKNFRNKATQMKQNSAI